MKYTEEIALSRLKKKKDCKISGRIIEVECNKLYQPKTKTEIVNPFKVFDLGNKSWGAISFLVRNCHYRICGETGGL